MKGILKLLAKNTVFLIILAVGSQEINLMATSELKTSILYLHYFKSCLLSGLIGVTLYISAHLVVSTKLSILLLLLVLLFCCGNE